MRKCLTRVCARRLSGGRCVASRPKKLALLEALLRDDYLPHKLTAKQFAAKEVEPLLSVFPEWAAKYINTRLYIVDKCAKPRLLFSQACSTEEERRVYNIGCALLAAREGDRMSTSVRVALGLSEARRVGLLAVRVLARMVVREAGERSRLRCVLLGGGVMNAK